MSFYLDYTTIALRLHPATPKSTDIRLRQPKEPSKGAHQPLVYTAVKTKVTIIVTTFIFVIHLDYI